MKYHIDTYKVKQYEDTRVVSDVEVIEDLKAKYVLCYVETLRANCLVLFSDLKPIDFDRGETK